MNDMLKINQNALHYMNNGDFSTALKLLRENAKKNPCHLSLNNLGKFYYDHGNIVRDSRWRSARALGLVYLLKAKNERISRINLYNIGSVLYAVGRYQEAYQSFELASTLDVTGYARYNAGVCLLAAKEYDQAQAIFQTFVGGNKKENSLRLPAEAVPEIAYLFSQLLSAKQDKDIKASGCYLDAISKIDDYDLIALLYLMGEFDEVVRLSASFLENWIPSKEIGAMILDSIVKSGDRRTGKKNHRLIEAVRQGVHSTTVEMGEEMLPKIANEYRFTPPLIEMCGYYGCTEHATPLPE